jgi:peptidoglycan/xylan/chitin deacetylase (PgdA/CDA1 family)
MQRKNYNSSGILSWLIVILFLATSSSQTQKRVSINYAQSSLEYIYLTFDDGPLNGSENIDSIILAERLKISVFLVGEHAEKSKQMGNYYKMYEQNPFVESYNHSYTHANDKYSLFYSKPLNVLADIQKNEKLLNLRFKVVRLPGRNIWRIGNRKKDDEISGSEAANLLAKNGYKLYGWDIEWQHNAKNGAPIQTVEEMTKEIENRLQTGNSFTKDHIVILIHDEMFQKKWEESELKELIDRLRLHQNYIFEHIRFYPDK